MASKEEIYMILNKGTIQVDYALEIKRDLYSFFIVSKKRGWGEILYWHCEC